MLCRGSGYQITGAIALALVASTLHAAPAPVVDTRSSSTSSNVTRDQLENLPVGRRVEDLVRTCPGNTIPTISRNPGVLIDGKPAIDLNCVQPADIEMVEVFKVHNDLRAEYGAPPLVWDPALIQGPKGAQVHANALAAAGTLFHSSRDGRGTVRENIGQGLAGASVGQMLGGWTAEKKNFIPGTFPNVSRTHSWYDIGHIAQMLWIQTVTIGCAKAAGIGSWLVCRYNPGGNKDGQLVGIPPERKYAVEQPKLPTTEVFRQPVQSASSDDTMTGRRASAFDLGIYAGGAYTTDWFDLGDRDPVIASTNIDDIGRALGDILLGGNDPLALNHEYGFDGALFVGYDLGAFRLEAEVAYKQADIDAYDTTIRLPGETAPSIEAVYNVDLEGPFAELVAEIFTLDEAEYFDALDQLSGIQYLNFVQAVRNNSFILNSFVSDQIGAEIAIDWSPIVDLLFRGSWAEGFGTGHSYVDPANPLLTQNGSLNLAYIWMMSDSVATAGGGASAASSGMVPEPGFDWPDIVANIRVDQAWGAAQLSAALHQLEAMNTFVPFDPAEAGYMCQPPSMFDLGIYAGGAYTTEWFTIDDDGALVDTKVEQPTLPSSEVFNPADFKYTCDDVM